MRRGGLGENFRYLAPLFLRGEETEAAPNGMMGSMEKNLLYGTTFPKVRGNRSYPKWLEEVYGKSSFNCYHFLEVKVVTIYKKDCYRPLFAWNKGQKGSFLRKKWNKN